MDITKDTQRIISCCTGLRGIERGLIRAGITIRPIVYLEIDAFICENLVCEMEAGLLAPSPIWTNLKTFDAKPFRGLVDGIIGGYPCPPFSNAGKRLGTEDPRHLYPFISGIIKTTGPVWCFFENVAGHLTLGYSEVSADLRSMGYAVEAGIYSAEEVGAPHQRDRLFILAIKQEFLEYSHNHGYDGTQDRKSNNEGENRNQAGQRAAIKLKGSSNTGECSEMGNPTSKRQQEPRSRLLSELPAKEGTGVHDRPEQPSIAEENMAHSSHSGLQGGEWGRTLFNQRQTSRRPITECGFNGWPARPGEQQYDWEEPRTIKSGMGSTVDGYNFREDLLRAYGNSVVEQTAEIAMIDLLKKHGLM